MLHGWLANPSPVFPLYNNKLISKCGVVVIMFDENLARQGLLSNG
jgi:hypothetical protein